MFTLTNMAAMEGAPLLMRLVSASVAVSHRAAKIAKDILKSGDLDIVEKSGKNDVQTEADRSAQRCIVASLHMQFPKIPIYGEEELPPTVNIPEDFLEKKFDQSVLDEVCPENLRNIKDEDVVIWVDPLDGTKEFTEGYLDHVTVLIGIAVNGVATAGVINQPFYNYVADKDADPDKKYGTSRAIWGVVGLGSFGFERNEKLEGNIITSSRSHSDYTVSRAIKACEPTEEVRVGGAGHKVLLLIEKKVHAYVFPSIGCKKWDTCAPEAILCSLGGRLTDIHGKPIPYHANVVHQNKGGVLATINDHQWYVDKIHAAFDEQTLAKFVSQIPAPPRLETALSKQKFDLKPNAVETDSTVDSSKDKDAGTSTGSGDVEKQ